MPRYSPRRPVPRAHTAPDSALYGPYTGSLPSFWEGQNPPNLGAELVKAWKWAHDNREEFLGLIKRVSLANHPPDMAG